MSSPSSAAARLGLEIVIVNGGTEIEIERAFATAVQQQGRRSPNRYRGVSH
jgi:hypothetical protein